jgi:hypothetical protein
MRIDRVNMTIKIKVDGEAPHQARPYHTGVTYSFRPTMVEVRVSTTLDEVAASITVYGFRQTKAGKDFKEPSSLSYSQVQAEWDYATDRQRAIYGTPAPDYVAAAVEMAKSFYAKAVY